MNDPSLLSLGDPHGLARKARLYGECLACIDNPQASPLLLRVTTEAGAQNVSGHIEHPNYGADLANTLDQHLGDRKIGLLVYSGRTDRFSILIVLATAQRFLSDQAIVLMDNADFTGVYDGIREALMSVPSYRLHEICIDYTEAARPGHGVATLSFNRALTAPQTNHSIPQSKNKQLEARFVPSAPVMAIGQAEQLVHNALSRWTPKDETEAKAVFLALQQEFPDGASPKSYWHEAHDQGFTEFFAWGHDQDFGFGYSRRGAMSTRHVEIVSEAIEYGYLPGDLSGLEVLDVGCWTGGDVLALAGLGANVTAIEEHPVSSIAAQRLCELLNVPAKVIRQSLYSDLPGWRQKFDVIYISGVIYHVTDPLLALRICNAYLRPGGRLVVETKASKLDGPYCEYSGTHEKGWNWYAPTLETLGRWMVDAGFGREGIRLHMRPVGRLLSVGIKTTSCPLPEKAGFSRPGSWLESPV